jgi:hypothetical protein
MSEVEAAAIATGCGSLQARADWRTEGTATPPLAVQPPSVRKGASQVQVPSPSVTSEWTMDRARGGRGRVSSMGVECVFDGSVSSMYRRRGKDRAWTGVDWLDCDKKRNRRGELTGAGIQREREF